MPKHILGNVQDFRVKEKIQLEYLDKKGNVACKEYGVIIRLFNSHALCYKNNVFWVLEERWEVWILKQ